MTPAPRRAAFTRSMPRLLPRLIKKLKEAPLAERRPRPLDEGRYIPWARTSAYRPVPDRPSFGTLGRTQSIVLDHMSPVTNRHLYLRHKSAPPRVHVATSETTNVSGQNRSREMTAKELEWWSSPYRTRHAQSRAVRCVYLLQSEC